MIAEIRGIDFGPIWGGSGVQGFFGEGYWHHKFLRLCGLTFDGVTFVAKTTTLRRRTPTDPDPQYCGGNLRLDPCTHQPIERFPQCIKMDFVRDVSWNAVGLTGPGAEVLINDGRWQARTNPFWLSFMAVENTKIERLEELRHFCEFLHLKKSAFLAPFGLQINLSCPNQKNDPRILASEGMDMLSIAGVLGIPIIIKISIATAPIEAVLAFGAHPDCDGVCLSNTIPAEWSGIDWKNASGSAISPLHKFGGGGFSGPMMVDLVTGYIAQLRARGFAKHINGGGGIRTSKDVLRFFTVGADSVFVATVASTRPQRMRSLIKSAHRQ